MLERFNLTQKNDVSVVLMRNIREELADIPVEYVKSVVYDMTTYDKMTIEVPSVVTRTNGQVVDVMLYHQIKGKQTIYLTVNGQKSRFIVDDNIKVVARPNGKVKTIEAYSYEKTLEKKTFMIGDGATRQLYKDKDEAVEVSDGILNWFEQQTKWKVGYVDELAKKEMSVFNITEDTTLFKNFSKDKVEVDKTLWSKSVTIKADSSFVITYDTLKTYDGDTLLKSETIKHTLVAKKAVKKITASYSSDSDYRFGLTYQLTYTDDTKESVKFGFANIKGFKITVDKMILTIQTSEFEERLTTKYRYFEHCSTTWYSFLMNDVASAFDCVFEFDTSNMILNCYHKDNYGRENGLAISYETGIKDINKTHKIGEVVTRLYVSSPNVSISEENKLGTEYVECFDYYIREGLMSEELQEALTRYDKLLEKKQIEWLTLKNKKNKTDQELTLKESELLSLQERFKAENAILTAYIKAGNVPDKQKEQSLLVEQLEKEITTMLKTVQTLKDRAQAEFEEMLAIGQQITKDKATDDKGKIFTQDDLDEIDEYIIEGSIENDYYTTSYSLYQHALGEVKKMNEVAIDFTINVDNLIKRIIHPQGWQSVVALGERIIVEGDVNLGEDVIQLTGFTYYPATAILTSLNFTNNKEPVSSIKSISDIGRATNQQTNMTNFWKSTWQDAKNNNINVSKLFSEGLDVAAQIVRGRGTVNKIDISESGIYIIDSVVEDNQLYLGSGIIAFTQDRWKNSELAVSVEGVIADSLIGKLILAEKLYIGNEDNTFVINPHGLSVYDSNSSQDERIFLGIEEVNGVKKARLRLHSAKNDKRLVLSEDGIYQVIPFSGADNFDNDNLFKLNFYIDESITRLDSLQMRLNLDKFRGYTKGASTTASSTTVQTTREGGGKRHAQTSQTGGAINYRGYTETYEGWNGFITTSEPYIDKEDYNKHCHRVEFGDFENGTGFMEHRHDVIVKVEDHTHDLEFETPAHTHELELYDSGHSHELEYGIYEFAHSPYVNIYLDDVLIKENVSSNQDLDLTKRLNLTKGWHSITVQGVKKTNNPLGLGRCQVDLHMGAFVSF